MVAVFRMIYYVQNSSELYICGKEYNIFSRFIFIVTCLRQFDDVHGKYPFNVYFTSKYPAFIDTHIII